MSLSRVRLELARTPETPAGAPDCGYELVAPLDLDGHLNPDAWRSRRNECTVRRFWHGTDDEHGQLVHTRRRRWAFSYAPGEDDDEPVWRLDTHRFVEGEYVSVTERDGVPDPSALSACDPGQPPSAEGCNDQRHWVAAARRVGISQPRRRR